MDWPLVHIILNHFPIVLAVMGTLAILLAVARGQRAIWLYGTISLTLAALAVLPTYFTGQPAEHAQNRPWYVAAGAIRSHEAAAKLAAVLVLVAGVVSLVAWRRLVRYPREVKMPGALRTGLLLTSIAASVSIGYASWLGSRMLHDAPALRGPGPAGGIAPGVPAAVSTPQPAVPAPTMLPPSDTTQPAGTPAPPTTAQP